MGHFVPPNVVPVIVVMHSFPASVNDVEGKKTANEETAFLKDLG